MAEQTKITALDNGPYLVRGPVVVVDAEGNEFPSKRETVALCRCGGSTTKPSCDVLIRRSVSGRRRGPSATRKAELRKAYWQQLGRTSVPRMEIS
jgi:CDGSH iron-sulfur domain-containing protein 3